MHIQGLLCGTIKGKVGYCGRKHETLQSGCLHLNPGSANHQPCDLGQDLTFLICRIGSMMVGIVSASEVCCKDYTSHILAQAIFIGQNGFCQQFCRFNRKFFTQGKC